MRGRSAPHAWARWCCRRRRRRSRPAFGWRSRMALVVAVATELIVGTPAGIGSYILRASQGGNQTDLVYAAVCVAGLLGLFATSASSSPNGGCCRGQRGRDDDVPRLRSRPACACRVLGTAAAVAGALLLRVAVVVVLVAVWQQATARAGSVLPDPRRHRPSGTRDLVRRPRNAPVHDRRLLDGRRPQSSRGCWRLALGLCHRHRLGIAAGESRPYVSCWIPRCSSCAHCPRLRYCRSS